MSSVSVKIFYAKGIRVSMKNKTFKEAMHLIWDSPAFKDYEPLKMIFSSTGKILFMDKNAFHAFLKGDISQQDLIEMTECEELYRNKTDFKADGFDYVVEIGSLWKLKNKKLTLIDDDRYVETGLSSFFEIAE